jgi:hypothetical protein
MTSGFLDNETPEPQVKPPTQWRSLSTDGEQTRVYG